MNSEQMQERTAAEWWGCLIQNTWEKLTPDSVNLLKSCEPRWGANGEGLIVGIDENLGTNGYKDVKEFLGQTRALWPTAVDIGFEWITPDTEPGEQHLTDLGNAKRLATLQGHNLMFCYLWGKWLVWDGARWAIDDCGEIERRAKQTVAGMYAEASEKVAAKDRKELARWSMRSESAQRLRAMISLTESELPIRPNDMDSNIWLLNVQNGTLDLKSGELLPHQREDLITKSAPVIYDHKAECPTWLGFLDRIMASNTNLIKWLQKAIGYSLVGDCREQAIFVAHGTGSNGKSTFIGAISTLLGDYALQTPTSTLLVKRNDGIPNDVARLKGARFVSAIEAEAGRRLAESLVKQITGGDKIAARFLHREWFDFVPECKVWLAVNRKPIIKGTDHAIWRRIRLIPFNVTIPDDEQDRTLPDKLKDELPGILNWAVKGCLMWQADGLGIPNAVRVATSEYRLEMDILGQFISDRCGENVNAKEKVKALYGAYSDWCEINGEKPVGKRHFTSALKERGYVPCYKERARAYQGIHLAENATQATQATQFSGFSTSTASHGKNLETALQTLQTLQDSSAQTENKVRKVNLNDLAFGDDKIDDNEIVIDGARVGF